jgi:hypothetical protein
MSWYAKITDFQIKESIWIDVDYFEDTNPEKLISRRLEMPLNSNKADCVAAIRRMGTIVESVHTLNTQTIIGTVITL